MGNNSFSTLTPFRAARVFWKLARVYGVGCRVASEVILREACGDERFVHIVAKGALAPRFMRGPLDRDRTMSTETLARPLLAVGDIRRWPPSQAASAN
ncbi:hypothetical protein P9250_19110 [Caballeronia sp. LP006]|uniref:hypothetical protein n=1 Tax=Caballeronia sp. LP006 TaxID=3038552 RepID=UPI0028558950|nr:hypothetical protein [Caballeronia sp. LP006]MDR5829986.1 hypothetical protein [Caballeronia sp. LP006]